MRSFLTAQQCLYDTLSFGHTAGLSTLHLCRLPSFTGPVPSATLNKEYLIYAAIIYCHPAFVKICRKNLTKIYIMSFFILSQTTFISGKLTMLRKTPFTRFNIVADHIAVHRASPVSIVFIKYLKNKGAIT